MSFLNIEAKVIDGRHVAPNDNGRGRMFEIDHLSLAYPTGRGYPAEEILNDVSA